MAWTMTIHLKEGAIPTKITTARKTPIHWLEPAKDAVDKLIKQDVLQVESDPTQWIARGFFVPKRLARREGSHPAGIDNNHG